jgi:hypothetical protein
MLFDKRDARVLDVSEQMKDRLFMPRLSSNHTPIRCAFVGQMKQELLHVPTVSVRRWIQCKTRQSRKIVEKRLVRNEAYGIPPGVSYIRDNQ